MDSLFAAKGSGGVHTPPAGSGGARPPNVFWCILGIHLRPIDCLMTNNFMCLLSVKKRFRGIFVIFHCPGRRGLYFLRDERPKRSGLNTAFTAVLYSESATELSTKGQRIWQLGFLKTILLVVWTAENKRDNIKVDGISTFVKQGAACRRRWSQVCSHFSPFTCTSWNRPGAIVCYVTSDDVSSMSFNTAFLEPYPKPPCIPS